MGQQTGLRARRGVLNFKGGTASFHSGVDFFPVMPSEGFYPEEDPMMGVDEEEMYSQYDSPLPNYQVPEDEYLFDDDIPEDEYTDEHLQKIEALLDQYESGDALPETDEEFAPEEDPEMGDPSMEMDSEYIN